MAFCDNCGNELSRSTKGTLCKVCYQNRNLDRDGENSQQRAVDVDVNDLNSTSTDNNTTWELGLNDIPVNDIPQLPDEWYKQDLSTMNAGHLVRIMMGFFHPLQEEMNSLKKKISDMERGNLCMATVVEGHTSKIEDAENEIKEKGKEINLLKKTVFNQQVFLENIQKKDLKNNIIITGIPNDVLEVDDTLYQSDEEKVACILNEVCDDINKESYKIISFSPAENRITHVCKVIFNDHEIKMNAIQNAKKLKNNVSLSKVFLQWDEPKLTRQENQRLRKVKWELKQEYPDDDIELKKGILKRNNQQTDKFNLMNQIF